VFKTQPLTAMKTLRAASQVLRSHAVACAPSSRFVHELMTHPAISSYAPALEPRANHHTFVMMAGGRFWP
jgi:hypothetical protein